MIKSVKFKNLKGQNKTYNLGNFNVFSGANGAGKSSILEAVRIGLCGYLSELGRLPSATMNIASDDIMSVAIGDGENVVERTFTRKGASCSQSVTLNGEPVNVKTFAMPETMNCLAEVVNIGEFISMTASKRSEFLARIVCGDDVFCEYESIKADKLEKEREIKRLTALMQSTLGLRKDNVSLSDYQVDEQEFLDTICGEIHRMTPERFRSMWAVFSRNLLSVRQTVKDAVFNEVLDRQSAEAEKRKMELESEVADAEARLDDMMKGFLDELRKRISLVESPMKIVSELTFGCEPYVEFIRKGKPYLSFGLVRHNGMKVPYETLSGGEKTILATALIAALQRCAGSGRRIGFFELAEADSDSFRAVLNCLTSLDYEQVFVASCHADRNDVSVPGVNFVKIVKGE